MTDALRGLLPKALEVIERELDGEAPLPAAVHVLKACGLYGMLPPRPHLPSAPPPAAPPCPRRVRRPQRAAAAPPERPAARWSAVWTSVSAWA